MFSNFCIIKVYIAAQYYLNNEICSRQYMRNMANYDITTININSPFVLKNTTFVVITTHV